MSSGTASPTTPSSPGAIAQAAADTMWATDFASQALGMELIAVGPGTAEVAMVVRPDMANGFGMAHGGFIFTLADSAFAYACNSYGLTTVAAHCSVTFLKAGKTGDRMVAVAREISRQGRSGIYDVRISVGDEVIAEFRGGSRQIGGSFIEGATPAKDA
jgi:acyl-CoA thioesterase